MYTFLTRAAAVLGVGALLIGSSASASADALGPSLRQHITVSWAHDHWAQRDQASFSIPGVGYGDVVCKPNTTWMQYTPGNRTNENSMWGIVFESKNGVQQTAVKDARVYEFSTPTSTIPHGTGPRADEGFNQFTPIEPASSGHMTGVFSSRGARNAPAGVGVAPTSYSVSWNWSGFGTASARCNVSATFITQTASPQAAKKAGPAAGSLTLNWHGESEAPAANARTQSIQIPGVGTLNAVCDTGTDGLAALQLTPLLGADPTADVTTYQAEGWDATTYAQFLTDPLSGTFTPIPLPVNGMLTADFYAGGQLQASLALSSERVTNDPNPSADYCEIASQVLTGPGITDGAGAAFAGAPASDSGAR